MTLHFSARLRERGFDVALDVAEGETVAVLGPNGAGKSTLLALIAGLLRPDDGRCTLADDPLFDLSSGRRAWRPAHERGIALLAQDALLFPHLSVRENVAFGPRSAGRPKREAREMAEHWLAEVDAAELADRPSSDLSGGQAQRIAVARALAAEPRLLLLDEPLAALDAAVAPALRRTLRRVLAGRTALIVTHDILDAYTLADRVIVMDSGRVVDSGPTRTVLDRPTSPFTAGLAALNLLTGVAAAGSADEAAVVLDDGTRLRATSGAAIAAGKAAAVAVRPSRVSLSTRPVAESAHPDDRNRLEATVLDLEPHGDAVRVRTDRLAADLSPGEVAALELEPGVRVLCSFAPDDALAYPL